MPVSASASAGSTSEIQVPSPKARLFASEYLGDGAPKPACLTGLPGHSDIPQGLRTIKTVGPQNSSTLTLLRLARSGFSEEGSLGSDGGDSERSYKGISLRAWRQRQGVCSSSLLGCGTPTGEMNRSIFEDRLGPDLGGPWASG